MHGNSKSARPLPVGLFGLAHNGSALRPKARHSTQRLFAEHRLQEFRGRCSPLRHGIRRFSLRPKCCSRNKWLVLTQVNPGAPGCIPVPSCLLSPDAQLRPLAGKLGTDADWLQQAYSVEELLSDILRGVFRGSPTINQVTIVDPEPFYEVDVFACCT